VNPIGLVPVPVPIVSPPVSWERVHDRLTVARRAGEVVGYVDVWGPIHMAFDGDSRLIGRFDRMDAAKTAIDAVDRDSRSRGPLWRRRPPAVATPAALAAAGMALLSAGVFVPFL